MTVAIVEDQEIGERPYYQTPYLYAKFYTAMRHRLAEMNLSASVVTAFIGVHLICDANTGDFVLDYSALRDALHLPKSTVYVAVQELLKTPLVTHVYEDHYRITDYEADRTAPGASYFNLTPRFIALLSLLVAHHLPAMILFCLEIMDVSRHRNSEILRKMRTLMYKKHLGSAPSRVRKNLALLDGFIEWGELPNASGTDVLLQFWLVKDDSRTIEQEAFRALHGAVSRETLEGYAAARGADTPTWRELSKSTRRLIAYGIDMKLHPETILRIASMFGAICAARHVKWRGAYLTKLLKSGDLLKQIPAWRLKYTA
ncbi:hypothetical protein [Alicyclobacillus ferrooxydans]|uniref:Uncharacterized protein n=1 Tax=Alicyclobacillus ferrooxydans TaxID=471514 RepID=A0A0P9CB55_9BACL|nr:hypothetical protein [Alicyclobacillus ferrooxydans]KPV42667.1 hypothetical protein AN477_16170 [Alicyclobacillus ferrooxydans]